MAKGFFVGVGNFKKRDLPSGYTQLEYIESTGSQYIDTGYLPSSSTRIVMDSDFIGGQTGADRLFGAWDAENSNMFLFLRNANIASRYYFGSSYTNGSASPIGRHVVDANENKVYIDGTLIITETASTFSCSYPLYLLALNDAGSLFGLPTIAKVYSCQIYDTGILVRDFIPAKNSSGEAGLFDIVTNTFYADASGTGFVAGTSSYSSIARKVKEAFIGIGGFTPRNLPDGFTQVEYIQSSGTQYIDTGFIPNQDTRVVSDYEFTGSETLPTAFGAWSSSSANAFIFLGMRSSNQARIFYDDSSVDVSMSMTGRHTVDMNKNIITFDGKSFASFETSEFSAAYPLFLCAYNNKGGVGNLTTMKRYSDKIYDNGNLVRDYIPAVNSSGEVGMFDLVTNTFYTDAAGVGFIAGGSDPNAAIARRIKEAYIGIGGIARPCWTGGELAYYGTATTGLSVGRQYLAATSISNYALFGGGNAGTYTWKDTVDAFDKNLTRTIPSSLSSARELPAATSVNNYALFGGGKVYSGISTVDTYDSSLIRTSALDLSAARENLAATTVGNYALFGGGYYTSASATVDTYNASLTKSTASSLSTGRQGLAATTVGDYAIFGAGYLVNSDYVRNVDAYNKSLTRTSPTYFGTAKQRYTATTVGDYALFGGGLYGSSYYVSVDAYNTSLTRTAPTDLSVERAWLAAATVGDYAIFAGGEDSSYDHRSTVDVYDASLTKTTFTDLSAARQNLAATTIGNYALFGGGAGGEYYATIDVYTVA